MSDDMFFDDEMSYTWEGSSPYGMDDYHRAIQDDYSRAVMDDLTSDAMDYVSSGGEWGQVTEPHPAPPYYGDGLEDPDPPLPTDFMHPNYDPNAIHDPPIESEGLGPLDWVSPLTAPLWE
jgi:hypothetical protein